MFLIVLPRCYIWDEWKSKGVGEVLAYKTIKSKYESKQFFEQADNAHRGNMSEVRKTFPGKDGLQELKRTDEGEFANKFPNLLLAKRHNPNGQGPMIQKLSANSFDKQGEYKRLAVQTLTRGEAWCERQEKWSEERTLAKEKRLGTRSKIKIKNILQDKSTEEQVESILAE